MRDHRNERRRGVRRRHAGALAVALAITAIAGIGLTSAEAGAGDRPRQKGPTTTPTWATTTTTPTTSTQAPTTTAPATSTTQAPQPALRRAALRITLETTSDWAQLDLPGVSAGHLVVTSAGHSEVQPLAGGVVIRGSAGVQRSVTVDVVTEVPSGLDAGWVTLAQGWLGTTSATLHNRTTALREVLTMSTREGTTATRQVTTDDLMGSTQLQWARADGQRRVLAFAYPWFGESAATDPKLSMHPSEPWRSWDPDDAVRAAQRARQNGIDGFVMSWEGSAQNGLALYQTLAAAEQTDGTATVLLEAVRAGSAAVAEQWITEALEQAGSPAFLQLDGVPVIFVFGGGQLTTVEWQGILQRLAAAGTPVRLVGDTWDGLDGHMTGFYRYNALLETEQDPMTSDELTDWNRGVSRTLRASATLGSGTPDLVVATVQPGWDDRPLRGGDRLAIPWNGVATYDATWSAAIAGEPDWVVITSWNEWFEGTGIAPSLEQGSAALAATGAWAQQLRG